MVISQRRMVDKIVFHPFSSFAGHLSLHRLLKPDEIQCLPLTFSILFPACSATMPFIIGVHSSFASVIAKLPMEGTQAEVTGRNGKGFLKWQKIRDGISAYVALPSLDKVLRAVRHLSMVGPKLIYSFGLASLVFASYRSRNMR